jgi:hypothetical protein
MEMKCPMCGGVAFDERRAIRYSDNGAAPSIRYSLRRGFLGFGVSCVEVAGRACLTCGYVVLSVDPAELREQLKEEK